MIDTAEQSGRLVVIVGAGPAGIYGARKFSEAGHRVLLLNRDIKPGGLAEYGIYFNKYKMKEGIRQQFRKILVDPRIHYFGNVCLGENSALTLQELQDILNPDAIVVAAGAQGTKLLGLPGEKNPGVYHAKDLVYHYNQLPPFSQHEYEIGDRVAIVGIGNVMIDIAHFLIHEKKVSEVIAVARRGPAQRSYTDVEIRNISANIELNDLRLELERIRPRLEAVNEKVEDLFQELTKHVSVAAKEGASNSQLKFRFLSSPSEIVTGTNGHPFALRVENTELIRKGDSIAARGLGTYDDIPADTIIFAVGDSVDGRLGLTPGTNGYVTNPVPDPENAGDEAYQVFDPIGGRKIDGLFVIGWSRQASDGLVGKARQDGERGVQAVIHYLNRLPPKPQTNWDLKINELLAQLQKRGIRTVSYPEVQRLEEVERREAMQRGIEFFKFSTNEEMFSSL